MQVVVGEELFGGVGGLSASFNLGCVIVWRFVGAGAVGWVLQTFEDMSSNVCRPHGGLLRAVATIFGFRIRWVGYSF